MPPRRLPDTRNQRGRNPFPQTLRARHVPPLSQRLDRERLDGTDRPQCSSPTATGGGSFLTRPRRQRKDPSTAWNVAPSQVGFALISSNLIRSSRAKISRLISEIVRRCSSADRFSASS